MSFAISLSLFLFPFFQFSCYIWISILFSFIFRRWSLCSFWLNFLYTYICIYSYMYIYIYTHTFLTGVPSVILLCARRNLKWYFSLSYCYRILLLIMVRRSTIYVIVYLKNKGEEKKKKKHNEGRSIDLLRFNFIAKRETVSIVTPRTV